MTRAQWNSVMVRYMHRADLTADLDQAFEFAKGATDEAWMGALPWSTDDELLAQVPRMMTHGGLMYLHELAQDDTGQARETNAFLRAASDAQFRHSLDTIQRPQATRPYYPEG